MHVAPLPEDLIVTVLDAIARGHDQLRDAVETIDAPLYVTDAGGVLTHFTPACVPFAGRTPQVLSDRWCVTWRLFTHTGAVLPHDQCPMATAVKQGRRVRGVSAIAERPDGTRAVFMPYPTPVRRDGCLVGAVNLLVDITDSVADGLRRQAAKARRLARSGVDSSTAETLERWAEEYDSKAMALEHG